VSLQGLLLVSSLSHLSARRTNPGSRSPSDLTGSAVTAFWVRVASRARVRVFGCGCPGVWVTAFWVRWPRGCLRLWVRVFGCGCPGVWVCGCLSLGVWVRVSGSAGACVWVCGCLGVRWCGCLSLGVRLSWCPVVRVPEFGCAGVLVSGGAGA
jgi:hypothetical protein